MHVGDRGCLCVFAYINLAAHSPCLPVPVSFLPLYRQALEVEDDCCIISAFAFALLFCHILLSSLLLFAALLAQFCHAIVYACVKSGGCTSAFK
mmetsp:Transcript_7592/g.19650  ORF Transcript_7592/g.19650 Transcript_7592/m.19650 type:complete len:94 (+) Transcript_7592:1124-1405(+)